MPGLDPPQPLVVLGVELLTRAREAGEIPADSEPEHLAFLLVAGFFGIQHVSWRLNGRADLADRVRDLLAQTLPMPAPTAAPRSS